MSDPASATGDRLEETRSLDGPRLRLVFDWTGDRWSHRIEIAGRPFAAPVELSPDQERPDAVVSPTYQQLNFQKTSDGSAQALVVGQSGPHHFSAVFTLREEEGRSTLEVDAADRSLRPVDRFAATYTVFATSGDLADADELGFRWTLGDLRAAFRVDPPAVAALAEAGRSATRVQGLAFIDPQRKTHRFLYRWIAESPSDPGL